MKLKYRIKNICFPCADEVWIAQYKILGMWININDRHTGNFFTPISCYCETFIEAKKRVFIHKMNMERASEWWVKGSNIVWKE